MTDGPGNGMDQGVDERSPPPDVWTSESPDHGGNGAAPGGWDTPGAAERVLELPVNYEVEQALIAAVLQNNHAFDAAAEVGVQAGHFVDELHGQLWQASSYFIRKGKGASALTLGPLFQDARDYIAGLQAARTIPSQVADYARTIRDLYLRRQLITQAQEMIERAQKVELDHDAGQVLEQALGELFTLAESGVAEGTVESVETVAVRVVREIEEIKARGGRVAGLATGLHDLDALTGGFEVGNLVILAARPGMGKSTLATGTSVNVANDGGAVLFFSLEMTRRDLVRRLLAERAGVSVKRLRTATVDIFQEMNLTDAAKGLGGMSLYLDDSAALTVRQMHVRARRFKRKHGLALVIIDHLGFVRPEDRRAPRVYQIEEAVHGLRAMAKDLGVPVLTLHQLNCAVEGRVDDRRPHLADLRDSGAVEQDADLVLFLYREAYYLAREQPRETASAANYMSKLTDWEAKMAKARNVAQLIVAKQRNGPLDTVKLYFDERAMRFDNFARVNEG